ncbi:MAG TPA: acetylglutamate kinase [Bacillales bacterium]|nr:acetylglutamate kinase [Bacillales bacterium]
MNTYESTPVIAREETVPETRERIVIKCGGSIVGRLTDDFYKSIREMQLAGYAPVIVHGGGPDIDVMLQRLQVPSEFVNGLRKTDARVMDVVEMTLSGIVNKKLVRKLNECGIQAVGLSGCDGRLLEAEPIDEERLGFVGKVAKVNEPLLRALLDQEIVPVLAPIGFHPSGERYNINADTAAAGVAAAIGAEKLAFVTDVPGILKGSKCLASATEREIADMIDDGTITGGMIPKVQAALDCLKQRVREVMIVSGETKVIQRGKIVGTAIYIEELEGRR